MEEHFDIGRFTKFSVSNNLRLLITPAKRCVTLSHLKHDLNAVCRGWPSCWILIYSLLPSPQRHLWTYTSSLLCELCIFPMKLQVFSQLLPSPRPQSLVRGTFVSPLIFQIVTQCTVKTASLSHPFVFSFCSSSSGSCALDCLNSNPTRYLTLKCEELISKGHRKCQSMWMSRKWPSDDVLRSLKSRRLCLPVTVGLSAS